MADIIDGYSKSVGVFPLVKHYMDELGLFELFKKYVPKGRADIEPAEGLCIQIVNILSGNRPLYCGARMVGQVCRWNRERR